MPSDRVPGSRHDANGWSRREFLGRLGLAGAVGQIGLASRPACAEPPPETTSLRIAGSSALCFAPQIVAEELLRAEGFTQIEYPRSVPEVSSAIVLAAGQADISMGLGANLMLQVDQGAPLVLLAGGMIGCYELFATEQVRGIRDLRGKSVAVAQRGNGAHLLLSVVLAYVGIDPRREIAWREHPWPESGRLLAEGKVDAFLGFPPEPQELRAGRVGHVVLNTTEDRPWSQYFCCMIAGNREFVRRHPVATKRALRAILKAADLCGREPERAARILSDRGGATTYEYGLQIMKDIPYGRWREYNPEDTVRFYALRLREIGMIKSSPQRLIAQGTDWRFLTELRKELKG